MLRRHYHRDRTTARAWATPVHASEAATKQEHHQSSTKPSHAPPSATHEPLRTRTEVVPVQLDAQAVADALAPVLTTALTPPAPAPSHHMDSGGSRHMWILVIVLSVLTCVSIICALMSLWMAASNARAVSKLQALLLASRQ